MSSDWAVSALKWWSDAGIDTIVGEEPRDWLNLRPQRVSEAPAPAPAMEPLPQTLAEFQAWLMSSNSLPGAAPGASRLGPSGDPAAEVMVLTDVPALEDFAAGQLVASAGLFDKMLKAIELSREKIYLASLSPLRPASGTLDSEALQTWTALARHHIGLVAPKTLLLLGDVCSKALLGAPVSRTRAKWHEIETEGGRVRTLAMMKPEKLILQPNLKPYAWEDLKMLREGLGE